MANALASLTKSTTNTGEDMNAQDNVALPPKPYTEYTIFFRLERTYLLQSSGIIDEEVVSSLDPTHYDPVEFPRPARYEPLALPPYWYSSSHKAAIEKKRKHRKRAGRMDLKTLSKTISASWRKADPVVVDYCKKLAKAELERYNKMIEMIRKDQDETTPGIGVTGGVQQQQKSSKLKEGSGTGTYAGSVAGARVMTNNAALSLQDFVFAQDKQQDNPMVMMQRPTVKVAPEVKSNGTLSLGFLEPKQVTNRAMPMTMPVAAPPATAYNNISSLRDGFNRNAEMPMKISGAIPPVNVSNSNMNRLRDRVSQNSTMSKPMSTSPATVSDNMNNLRGSFNQNRPMSMPVATPRVAVSNNMKSLRDSFNEVMGYSSNSLQFNEGDQTDQTLQLQAAQIRVQQQKLNLRGDASPTYVKSSSPFLTNAGGVRPENRPEKKNKRKFVRRATAPPEFLIHGNFPARPHVGGNNDVVTCGDAGGVEAFLGEDGPKQMKRRSSMVNMESCEANGKGLHLTARDLLELKSIRRAGLAAAQELSNSFEKELDNRRFTHVPKWEKEDADELLDILNVPQVSEPVVADKPGSLMGEEMRMFMGDIGMGDASFSNSTK